MITIQNCITRTDCSAPLIVTRNAQTRMFIDPSEV
jgi:hypothetical protein